MHEPTLNKDFRRLLNPILAISRLYYMVRLGTHLRYDLATEEELFASIAIVGTRGNSAQLKGNEEI